MPGTIGRSDLFKVDLLTDGSFGVPTNLGKTINTEGRETFPFVSSDNELYFATDGRPGLGGLDIFVTKLSDAKFSTITNLGMPVNSSFDDFAFIIDSSNNQGYLSSNRLNGKGNDDIYKIKLADTNLKGACAQSISGVVNDLSTGKILTGAKVVLLDASMNVLKEGTSDSNGKFDFGTAACGNKHYIRTSMPEFITVETPFLVAETSGITYVPVALNKIMKPINLGDDLAKLLDIPMIYFDLDKSFVRADAAVELSKILDVMQQNPAIKIDVRSHTDSRNTAQYNADLSERRAKATVAWLVGKGIDKLRLTGNGFGETRLINGCADGVKCTEEDHQLNRRSEFIIVSK